MLQQSADRIVHHHEVPYRPPVVEPWPDWIDPAVVDLFRTEQISALWSHQAEAMRLLQAGNNIVLATGTASGKSLAFLAPVLSTLAAGRTGSALDRAKTPSVLYLSPTKALAADQLRRLPRGLSFLRPAAVDGDNSREERDWARGHANYVLSNPDVLHHSMLPGHQRWARLFGGLQYVVIDECHQYRGVFGAHVAQVLRRLRRVCAHYGSQPQWVALSATVAEPQVSAERLLGVPVQPVVDDTSEHGAQSVVLWEPPLVSYRQDAPAVRRGAEKEAANLLTDLVSAGVRTVCFARSRGGSERIAANTREQLDEVDPDLAARVATYRGGYLPEERRDLEAALRSGELLGLASTNALELGIDIAGLDAVVSVGFPGTRAALLQQFGRAGRRGNNSLGVLVARDEPIDSYLIHHPELLFEQPVEATVFDPDNPYVLGPHLAAAAQEIALTEADFEIFGPRAADGVAALEAAGMLRRRSTGWFWTSRDRASDLADLRSSGGRPVQVVESSTGRLVGTVDAGSADSEVHSGAIYVHQGRTFRIADYDHEERVAMADTAEVAYRTSTTSATAVQIVHPLSHRDWGPAQLWCGDVLVSSQVTGFQLREKRTGHVLGEDPLELPVRNLATRAVWWTLDDKAAGELGDSELLAGAAHAAEHAAIGLLPLLAICDRWDIGGLSTVQHPDTGKLTVFVYDGYPGGAGFAERGFEVAQRWLTMTRDLIIECPCSEGCPRCVVSPKCGNANNPLDKTAAAELLGLVLAESDAAN